MRQLRAAILLGVCFIGFRANLFGLIEGNIDERNYRLISIGMEKEKVIRLIGMPMDLTKGGPEFPAISYFPGLARASIWKNDQMRVVILFDSDCRVIWKRFDWAELSKAMNCCN